jgi:hypothetical protein
MLQLMQSTENSSSAQGGILNAKWRTIRYVFAKRSFESQLATILRAAAGHEANQVPAGAHEYQLLNTEADSLCSTFATKWNLDIENLKVRIPALLKLNSLSMPTAALNYARLTCFGMVAIPVVSFLLGTVAGLMRLGFHLVAGGH